MPTYEYVCGACGHEFERFQKITARPLRKCPECGNPKAERRISAGGGLLFKGPGFYATDYRRGGPPKEEKAETSGGTAGEKGKADGASGSGDGKGAAPAKERKAAGDGHEPAGGP